MAYNRSKYISSNNANEFRPQHWVPTKEQSDSRATKSKQQRKMDKCNITVSLPRSSSTQPTLLNKKQAMEYMSHIANLS